MQNLELKIPIEHKDAKSFNINVSDRKKVNQLLDKLVEVELNYDANGSQQSTKNYFRFGDLVKAGFIKGVKLDNKDITNSVKIKEKLTQKKSKRTKKDTPYKGETVVEPLKKSDELPGARGGRALN